MSHSTIGAVAFLSAVVLDGCGSSSSGTAGSATGAGGTGAGGSGAGGSTSAGGAGSGVHADATLVDNGDGTLSDAANGLMWETVGDTGPWYNFMVNGRCNTGLKTGGKTGWRMPTVGELRTLVVGCPASQAAGPCPTPPSGPNCGGCAPKDAGRCYMAPNGFPQPCEEVWALPEGSHVNFENGSVSQTIDLGTQARAVHCVRDLPLAVGSRDHAPPLCHPLGTAGHFLALTGRGLAHDVRVGDYVGRQIEQHDHALLQRGTASLNPS